MRPARVVLLVLGSILALVGLACAVGGAALGWALATQVDQDGFFTTPHERFATETYAITSDDIDLGEPGPDADFWRDRDAATVRITVDPAGQDEVFVGIGPEQSVEEYLRGVPHDEVTHVDFFDDDVDYRREHRAGRDRPEPPAEQDLWVASAAGAETQVVAWDVEPGRWAIVIMDAEGDRGVDVDVELAAKSDLLAPLALGLGLGGAVLLVVATALLVAGVARPHAREQAEQPGTPTAGALAPVHGTAVSAVRLEATLDPDLSRWQWLVKWILAIPHYVVLAFLWVAFVLLSVVAWVSIVVTGRYPRAIFDFNVGVLRWTWRVAYYATSVLGTDRYPPFTLAAVDYPAQLDVAYPEQLSRGLALVKSWLLAIPHWVVLGILMGGWQLADDVDRAGGGGGGLIALLAVVAGVILLVTCRYPQGLFDLLMGLNRWVLRVGAYVALMTDEYPPFRLDQGGSEPSGDGEPPPPTTMQPEPPQQPAPPPPRTM